MTENKILSQIPLMDECVWKYVLRSVSAEGWKCVWWKYVLRSNSADGWMCNKIRSQGLTPLVDAFDWKNSFSGQGLLMDECDWKFVLRSEPAKVQDAGDWKYVLRSDSADGWMCMKIRSQGLTPLMDACDWKYVLRSDFAKRWMFLKIRSLRSDSADGWYMTENTLSQVRFRW